MSTQLSSQCVLACNDELQINLNLDGNFEVTPALLFQGNIANCTNLGVELYDQNSNYLGTTLSCAQAGTTVIGRLVNYDNNAFCDTQLSVFDNIAPVFSCPDLVVFCNAPFSPDSIGYPIVTDNCTTFANDELFFSDQGVDLDCFETFNGNAVTARIDRTWLVSDASGNQGQCTQVIYLLRSTLSDVVFPSNLSGANSLTCSIDDPTDLSTTGEPLIEGRKIDNSGYCEISTLYNDLVFNTCGGSTTTIRKWIALDVCTNNILEYDQIIEVNDKMGPVIDCPADITISAKSFTCDADVVIPNLNVTDECSDFTVTPNWEFGQGYGPFIDVPAGQHTLTYTAADACGNTSLCTINVNIIDDTPPSPVCENSVSVSLLPVGVARIFAATFDEGTLDNCGLDRIEVRRGADPFGEFVEFYCDDVASQAVLVQMRAFDMNGLFNDCWIQVSVNDNFAPTITCPNNITLECQDDVNDLSLVGQPIASDACGVDTMYFEDVSNLQCGVGVIQREWTVVDLHGNSNTCIQAIQLEDNTVLDIVFPQNTTVDFCNSTIDINQTGTPTISGQGCKNILANHEDQVFSSTSFCYSILRTWTVIDWCEYDPNSGSSAGEFTHVQRIDIVDNTSPEIFCASDTLVLNLSNDCSSTYVNFSLPTATDCSDDTFIKNNSPFADAPDADASGFYPNGTHTIEYTAFDNCGNATTCTRVVEVKDGLAPNLSCNNGLSIDLSSNGTITIDPSLLIASVSDNCTAASQLTFQLTPNTFSCADIGLQNVALTATDLEGNVSTCNTTIDIQDNMFNCLPAEVNITGRLLNLLGQPVPNKEVSINGMFFSNTDFDGFYSFENLTVGQDYIVEVTDEPLDMMGVSTFDMVLTVAHILQTRKLDNPYRMIAVDVDNDHSISVFDVIGIRQVVLEQTSRYTSNIAWKCVDANFVFTDVLNPFLDDYPLQLNFTNLTNNVNTADFVAIKLGDVDGSGSNLVNENVEARYYQNATFNLKNKNFTAGNFEEIEFALSEDMDSHGLQFELLFDTDLVDFEGLTFDEQLGMNNDNYRYDSLSNTIKLSWNTTGSPKALLSNNKLFTLRLKVKKNCNLKEAFKMINKSLRAEIYDAQFNKLSLDLAYVDEVEAVTPNRFLLAQNFPNPVLDRTNIQITSHIETAAQLLFTDIQGNSILTKSIRLAPGVNNILFLTEATQGKHDLLFYTLMIDENIVGTKKMILQK